MQNYEKPDNKVVVEISSLVNKRLAYILFHLRVDIGGQQWKVNGPQSGESMERSPRVQ